MTNFILASSSPYRVTLLKQIGFAPDLIVSPDIDETPHKKESGKALALRLAQEKAQKVLELHKGSIILAGDTVVSCGKILLPKAETEEQASYCYKVLSGRKHKIYTGVAVIDKTGKVQAKVALTVIRFKRLHPSEVELLMTSRQWKDKAGGYALQGLASAFIEKIDGCYTTVTGLPVYVVNNLLAPLLPRKIV